MPIYEFECGQCGHRFDRLQRLSDPDPQNCPQCGVAQVQRRVTAPAFRLAGSGWYETDFKKDGDKKRNLASHDDSSAGAKPSASDGASASAPAPSSTDKAPTSASGTSGD